MSDKARTKERIYNGNGQDPAAFGQAMRVIGEHDPEAAAAAQQVLARRFAEETPEAWPVFTLADAYKPRPPRQYIVHGLIKLPSLSIVYGPPGSLKTMLMIDMAASVAKGEMWLPPLPDKDSVGRLATQAPVLWCDFDNGADDMHERIEAIGKAHELPGDAPLFYVSMPSSWLDASDAAGPSFSQLTATVQATEAKLVIVDNLAVVSGSVDENSADMTTVLSSFRQLSEDTGAAVVLVHHQRKQTGFKTRAGDTLRGHSGIEAALNLALLIEREEHAESITLRATKTRGVTVLPFGAMFSYEHKQDSDELAEARFFGLELEDTTSNAAIERAIIEELKNTPSMTQRQLIDGIKASLDVGIHRIRNAANGLTRAGQLTTTTGAHRAKLYSLPQHDDVAYAETLDIGE